MYITFILLTNNYLLSINVSTNTSTDRTVKSLCYLDDLEKEYDDPIAYFKEVDRKMTEEEDLKKKLTLSISMDEKLSPGTDNRKNDLPRTRPGRFF